MINTPTPVTLNNDATSNKAQNPFVSIRAFPQIQSRQLLRINLLRAIYSRLTNNKLCYQAINHRYTQAFKKKALPELSSLGLRIVSDLKANGVAFAKMSDFFDEAFFDVIKNCFDAYLQEFNRQNFNIKSSHGKASYLDTIHKSHTFIPNDPVSSYLSAPAFADIAAHYLQMVPRFVGSSFWHTRIITDNQDRIYSQQWHRDYNDRSLVKIFLYVTDVGPKEGYFEYLAGSHSRGDRALGQIFDRIGSDGYRAYPQTEKIEKFIKKIPTVDLNALTNRQKTGSSAIWHRQPTVIRCIAPKATLIFADTFGLHRGGYVEAGYRDMIMTTYSTNFNVHKPHFTVTQDFAKSLSPFMQMSFGII